MPDNFPSTSFKHYASRRQRTTWSNRLARWIGSRIQQRRLELGMPRSTLARTLDVSDTQIEAYEQGIDAVDAASLIQIASTLEISISFFYVETPVRKSDDHASGPAAIVPGLVPSQPGARSSCLESHDPPSSIGSLELVRAAAFIQALDTIRAYCRLADPRMRRIVLETIKDLLPPDEALLPDNETDTNQNIEPMYKFNSNLH